MNQAKLNSKDSMIKGIKVVVGAAKEYRIRLVDKLDELEEQLGNLQEEYNRVNSMILDMLALLGEEPGEAKQIYPTTLEEGCKF